MQLAASLEGVDSGLTLGLVELGRVFQIPDPALVHFLGDPAVVADMRVPLTLVERDDYALSFGRAVTGRSQPGPIGLMLLDVGCGVLIANLRQASTAGLEPLQASPVGAFRSRPRICRVRVVLASASWGRAFLAAVCVDRCRLARIRLDGFCLAGFWLIRLPFARGPLVHDLPHDDGVFGARGRLRARLGFTGAIAGVRRVAASGKITVIGLVPAATQFGHDQVWAEMRARHCDG